MTYKRNKSRKQESLISFAPVAWVIVTFGVLTMVILMAGALVISAQRMEGEVKTAHRSALNQVSNRVNESLKLLGSLAVLEEYYDPAVPPLEKVAKLDQITEQYGYMMICFVDSDINVYTIGEEPASLASRDYMQQLFSTGDPQVTDSFAAGADGITLNYTVAYPLKQDGQITGCIFCAIYFDDVVEILKDSAVTSDAKSTLIGSRGQIMSSADDLQYGEPYMEYVREARNLGITADQLETELLGKVPGSYWSVRDGSLYCTVYSNVENTNWDILTSISFWDVYGTAVPGYVMIGTALLILSIFVLYLTRHYILQQKKVVDMLLQSIQELEEKIYQDERPDNMDFKEIIKLTSNGLSDGLTGVVTRSVFLRQAEAQLRKAPKDKLMVLCFVDLDNLKRLNDTYGHNTGDTALKSTGYILREYEKKYDGVVGRYGGDEFVLLLTDIDSEEELKSVLDAMVLQLHTDIGTGGTSLPIHCSIGVAVKRPEDRLEEMIANADEALYFVKQNGKGYYRIYQD